MFEVDFILDGIDGFFVSSEFLDAKLTEDGAIMFYGKPEFAPASVYVRAFANEFGMPESQALYSHPERGLYIAGSIGNFDIEEFVRALHARLEEKLKEVDCEVL